MKALLLAAGRSKRMKPVEDKNFLNFLGKPLIEWQLEMLMDNGFEEVIIIAGAHNLERMEQLAEMKEGNVQVVEQEDLEKGMCNAVLSAENAIGGDSILIFSSNDVVEEDAFSLIKDASENNDADSYILGKQVDEYFPGGYLEVNDEGFINHIVEKPGEGNEPSDMVNLVVHLHKNSGKLMEYLKNVESDSDDLYEVALAKMMDDGVKMKAVAYDGFWQPVKYPWHVQKVFEFLFNQNDKAISPNAHISENAVINGKVIIGENVKIFDGAVVNGPVYIGNDSIVATNALVRESNVGEKCVIGFGSEVARSFLGNDVWTHTNYIGDSVIGNNVSFGAGTVIGNLRLDEENIMVNCDDQKVDSLINKFGLVTGDNVRFGINCSTMPGIKVGSGSFVGAGIVVAQDVPENSFVRGEWNLKISENIVKSTKDRGELKKKLN
ncbi:sugar phosphate nucleotidyltransferase [Patescibacteria group bacterium]